MIPSRSYSEEETINMNNILILAKDSDADDWLNTPSPHLQHEIDTTSLRTQRSSGGVSIAPRKAEARNNEYNSFNGIIIVPIISNTFSAYTDSFSFWNI